MVGVSNSCLDCSYLCLAKFFAKDEIDLINANRSEQQLASGEVIVRQGSFVSQFIYLKSGVVKKVIREKNKRNTIVKVADEGNYLALPIMGSSNQYPFSIITLSSCSVCIFKKDILYELIKNNEKAFDFIMQWYANDYMQMYSKISTMSTRNSHGKVASALLYLTDESFNTDMLGIVTRQELAELSSTSKESVNKIIQQLNHDGLIEIGKDRIDIKRRDLLEKLSTVG